MVGRALAGGLNHALAVRDTARHVIAVTPTGRGLLPSRGCGGPVAVPRGSCSREASPRGGRCADRAGGQSRRAAVRRLERPFA